MTEKFQELLGSTTCIRLSEVHIKFNGHATQDMNRTQTLLHDQYGTSVDTLTNMNFYHTTRILWNATAKLLTQHGCVMQECIHLNSP